jgi:hypothetical protein
MIQKTFRPTFALLSVFASAQAADTTKPTQSEHIVIPPLEAPVPEKVSGQYSCQMELIEARGLTLEQANQLLETARTPNPKFKFNPAQDALDHLHGKPVVRKNWSTPLQEKWAKTGTTPPTVKIMSAPMIITRSDSEKGGWIKIKSPEGSFEFANKCLAAKPDADGYLPLDLSLITGSRDANGKEVLKTNKGTVRVKSGVPLLLADTPELTTPPAATTNPLIMRIVPGPDYEVKFIRVSMTYISPEEIYGKPNGERLR